MKKYSFILLLFCAVASSLQSLSQKPATGVSKTGTTEFPRYPKAKGWINDFEGLLTKNQVRFLDSLMAVHQQKTTNQMCLVTAPASYYPKDSLVEYSRSLFNKWGVGTREKNNGVGILLSKQNRQIRINIGYGLEQVLTNRKCQEIIDDYILPLFKQGKYYEGIKNGITEIIRCLNESY